MECGNTDLDLLGQEEQAYQAIQAEKILAQQQKLFNEELPKWESTIAQLAFNLLNTRAIDKGLLGVDDVRNMLRMVMWNAIKKYNPDRGTALNVWITNLMRQECSLITQAHYNKVPRERKKKLFTIENKLQQMCLVAAFNSKIIQECIWKGFKAIEQPLDITATVEVKKKDRLWYIVDGAVTYKVKQLQKVLTIYQDGKAILPVPLVGSLDKEEGGADTFLDIEDPRAVAAYEELSTKNWFRKNTDLIFKILQNRERKYVLHTYPGLAGYRLRRKGLNEKKVFAMILSGKYGSDREISELLDINFAKVGEVRFKARIVFALIEGIPLSEFSQARNVIGMAKRLRTQLLPYIGHLPDVIT